MNKLNKLFIVIPTLIVLVLSGCGKYEDGPGISIRTKNGRLEGKWKVTSIKYERNDPVEPIYSESFNFNGSVMTETSNEPVFDPITFEITGYSMVSDSYTFSETMEFDTKDNTCIQSTTDDGVSSVTTQLWTWNDGAKSKEILDIAGMGSMIVKKLTNKELHLFQDYTENGAYSMIEYKLEKIK